MQVSVASTGQFEKTVTVTFPPEKYQTAYDKRLKEVSKDIRLDGFRPGKAPIKVIEARFGNALKDEITHEIVRETIEQVFTEHHLMPLERPELTDSTYVPGESFSYVLTMESYPDVALPAYSEIAFNRYAVEITEDDIDTLIEISRKQHATWDVVETPAETGNMVVLDYTCGVLPTETTETETTAEASEADDATAETSDASTQTAHDDPVEIKDAQIIIGEKQMIDGFEEALIGATTGQTVSIELPFPTEYFDRKMAGKIGKFEISVKEIKAAKLPEIDADFIKKMGAESGEVSELRSKFRQNMQVHLDEALEEKLKEDVFQSISAKVTVALPEKAIEQEMQEMMENTFRQIQAQYGVKEAQTMPSVRDLPADVTAEWRTKAEAKVKQALIMNKLIESADIKIEAEAIDQKIQTLASKYERPEQFLRMAEQKPEIRTNVERMLQEERAIAHVGTVANVTIKPLSYTDTMEGKFEPQEDTLDKASDTAAAA